MVMTHHARLNLIMAVTITSLMVFLYFRPQSQNNPEYPIADRPAGMVQSVRIVKPQQEIALKRLNDHWYLTEPLHAWADDEKIAKILEILQAKSQQRFSQTGLERFGLERPNTLMDIDNLRLGFGGFAPTTNQQYVATGDHVYLIAPRYGLALPGSVNDLINSKLLAPDEIPVKFELPHFTAEFQDGNWRVTLQQDGKPVTADALADWIQRWQSARAAELILAPQLKADFVATGLLKISLQNGRQISLKIWQNGTSTILLRMSEGIGYQFPLDTSRLLLDPSTLAHTQTAN